MSGTLLRMGAPYLAVFEAWEQETSRRTLSPQPRAVRALFTQLERGVSLFPLLENREKCGTQVLVVTFCQRVSTWTQSSLCCPSLSRSPCQSFWRNRSCCPPCSLL